MKSPGIGVVLFGAMAATGATAAVTTAVVDIPVGAVTQRFLYVTPEAPVANIVSLPGGDGYLGITNDGQMATQAGQCSPMTRTREALADRGFAVALVDQDSAGSVRG